MGVVWTATLGSYWEAHAHRTWDTGRTELQSQGAASQVVIKRSLSDQPQGKRVRPTENVIQHKTPYLIPTRPHPPLWSEETGRGCLSNFRPNEGCYGNCSGDVHMAPKLQCSGKTKGNRHLDHRSGLNKVDFPLADQTEQETMLLNAAPSLLQAEYSWLQQRGDYQLQSADGRLREYGKKLGLNKCFVPSKTTA